MTTTAGNGKRSEVPPSVADAERAARVLVDAGVSQVMLFGSVARGEQTPQSDIDLMAIYNDVDYDQRHSLATSLSAAATKAAGHRVDVLVTDRPEWSHRTQSLKTSMERHIASYGRILVDQPPEGVNHGKEMVSATTDLDEARHTLGSVDHAASLLRSYLGEAISSRRESPNDTDSYHTALLWACAAAHKVIADSISALIHLQALPGLHTWGPIYELCYRLQEPHRSSVSRLLTPPGAYYISHWRESTIPDWTQHPRPRPKHDGLKPSARLVEAIAWAACRTALYTDDQIPESHTNRLGWANSPTERVIETLEGHNLKTGQFHGHSLWGDHPNKS